MMGNIRLKGVKQILCLAQSLPSLGFAQCKSEQACFRAAHHARPPFTSSPTAWTNLTLQVSQLSGLVQHCEINFPICGIPVKGSKADPMSLFQALEHVDTGQQSQ